MKALKLTLSFLIGACAFWICLKDVHWSEVAQSLKGISPAPALMVVICLLIAYFFRARRWSILVKPIQAVSWQESFAVNAVGFLSIHILPFRLGEFTRPYLLKKRHQVPMSSGMAIVLIERIFDGLASTLALFIGLWAMPDGIVEMSGWSLGVGMLAWGSLSIFFPLLLGFMAVVWKRDWTTHVFRVIFGWLPHRFSDRLNAMLTSFLLGLSSIPDPRLFFRVALETIGVWGVMPLAYAFLLRSFGLDLPWSAPFALMGIAALGVMVPGPPGFVGTFQLFVQGALLMYGVSKSVGFAYAMVFYILNMVFVLLMGSIFLNRVSTPLSEVVESASEAS